MKLTESASTKVSSKVTNHLTEFDFDYSFRSRFIAFSFFKCSILLALSIVALGIRFSAKSSLLYIINSIG